MASENNIKSNAWIDLILSIYTRSRKAIHTPSFVFTFLIVIVTCGSCGIWIPFLLNTASASFYSEAVLTYGVSILASIAAEILLCDKRNKNEKMLFFSIVIISLILLVCGLLLKKVLESNIGVLFVLSLWFISNADDEKYDEKQPPISPLGGADTSSNRLSGEGLK